MPESKCHWICVIETQPERSKKPNETCVQPNTVKEFHNTIIQPEYNSQEIGETGCWVLEKCGGFFGVLFREHLCDI